LSYRLLRNVLFRFDAETIHHLTVRGLGGVYALPGGAAIARAVLRPRVPPLPVRVMGIDFANPVGLAAGLDKNAECARPFSDFGFGWLELGTVTPRPQPGNPRPRLFRLIRHHAIINRMGFNNVGVAQFLNNLVHGGQPCPIGVNIGKNKDTPNEQAVDDYVMALRAVYPHADYVAVNISSPNTPGLRALQEGGNLEHLLAALKSEQARLHAAHDRYVPIALKIAPDLDDDQIAEIARLLVAHAFDAVIATNTTIARPGLNDEPLAREVGGLSGRPLKEASTAVVRKLYAQLRGRVPIIGVGGIESAEDAWDKLVAGADAVQIYSALIYQGPAVIERIAAGLAERVRASGCATLAEALAKKRLAPR
jgi:dihydroorotate dehydrogenase